jgi:hypothetical protein
MRESGRSPAQIDADVAALQEQIRRARAAAAGSAGDSRDTDDAAQFHSAVVQVALATRLLVDYEGRIPAYQEQYRRFVDARTIRWSGALLALVAAELCLAVVPGRAPVWWLGLLAALVLAGLWAVPGADRRAAGLGPRPRVGAFLFGLAAVLAALCVLGLVTAWAAPAALCAAGVGLRAFGAASAWDRDSAPARTAGAADMGAGS